MQQVDLVFLNSHDAQLDNVRVTVGDSEDCTREVLAAIQRQKWTLSAGDTIKIVEVQG